MLGACVQPSIVDGADGEEIPEPVVPFARAAHLGIHSKEIGKFNGPQSCRSGRAMAKLKGESSQPVEEGPGKSEYEKEFEHLMSRFEARKPMATHRLQEKMATVNNRFGGPASDFEPASAFEKGFHNVVDSYRTKANLGPAGYPEGVVVEEDAAAHHRTIEEDVKFRRRRAGAGVGFSVAPMPKVLSTRSQQLRGKLVEQQKAKESFLGPASDDAMKATVNSEERIPIGAEVVFIGPLPLAQELGLQWRDIGKVKDRDADHTYSVLFHAGHSCWVPGEYLQVGKSREEREAAAAKEEKGWTALSANKTPDPQKHSAGRPGVSTATSSAATLAVPADDFVGTICRAPAGRRKVTSWLGAHAVADILSPTAYTQDFKVGDTVTLTLSISELSNALERVGLSWSDKMLGMLGGDYAVLGLPCAGIVALPSPDGSNGGEWSFPIASVTKKFAYEEPERQSPSSQDVVSQRLQYLDNRPTDALTLLRTMGNGILMDGEDPKGIREVTGPKHLAAALPDQYVEVLELEREKQALQDSEAHVSQRRHGRRSVPLLMAHQQDALTAVREAPSQEVGNDGKRRRQPGFYWVEGREGQPPVELAATKTRIGMQLEAFGAGHAETAKSLTQLGHYTMSCNKFKDAQMPFESALAIQKAIHGRYNFEYAAIASALGQAYQRHAYRLLAEGTPKELNAKLIFECNGNDAKPTQERRHNIIDAAKFHFGQALNIDSRWIAVRIPQSDHKEEIEERTLEVHVSIRPGAKTEFGDSLQFVGNNMKVDELVAIAGDVMEDDHIKVSKHPHVLQKISDTNIHWICTEVSPLCSRSTEPGVRWQCKTCHPEFHLCRGCAHYFKEEMETDIYGESIEVYCMFMDTHDVAKDELVSALNYYRQSMKVLDHVRENSLELAFALAQIGRLSCDLQDVRSAADAYVRCVDILADALFDNKVPRFWTESEEVRDYVKPDRSRTRISDKEVDRVSFILPLQDYAAILEEVARSCVADLFNATSAKLEDAETVDAVERALSLLDKAAGLREKHHLGGQSALRCQQGTIFARIGRTDLGMNLLKSAAHPAGGPQQPDPRAIMAQYNLALLYSRLDRPNEAAKELKLAKKALSAAGAATDSMAFTLVEQRLEEVTEIKFTEAYPFQLKPWDAADLAARQAPKPAAEKHPARSRRSARAEDAVGYAGIRSSLATVGEALTGLWSARGPR